MGSDLAVPESLQARVNCQCLPCTNYKHDYKLCKSRRNQDFHETCKPGGDTTGGSPATTKRASEAEVARNRLGPLIGGESGIRTHGGVSPTHAFQACSFSHSDISPGARAVWAGTRGSLRAASGLALAEGGGEGGIRTPVRPFDPKPISSRSRYDHFGTSPCGCCGDEPPQWHGRRPPGRARAASARRRAKNCRRRLPASAASTPPRTSKR